MSNIHCSEISFYRPREDGFDQSKVRCRFLLTLVDDDGVPVTEERVNADHDPNEPEAIEIPVLDSEGRAEYVVDPQGNALIDNPAHDPSIPLYVEIGSGDPATVIDGKPMWFNGAYRPRRVRARMKTNVGQNPRYQPPTVKVAVTHGYEEPHRPEGFAGVVAPGLEYDFPHDGDDKPFAVAGAPTEAELRACVSRVAAHWLSQVEVGKGKQPEMSASRGFDLRID